MSTYRSEKGQGAVEYLVVLVLALFVALAVAYFLGSSKSLDTTTATATPVPAEGVAKMVELTGVDGIKLNQNDPNYAQQYAEAIALCKKEKGDDVKSWYKPMVMQFSDEAISNNAYNVASFASVCYQEWHKQTGQW